jgi:uncharacterized protein (DUF1786 family)
VTDDIDAELENLRRLEAFFIPLSPEEAAERRRIMTEAGTVDVATIIRALGGGPSTAVPP